MPRIIIFVKSGVIERVLYDDLFLRGIVVDKDETDIEKTSLLRDDEGNPFMASTTHFKVKEDRASTIYYWNQIKKE
jgi:hypothetical protein